MAVVSVLAFVAPLENLLAFDGLGSGARLIGLLLAAVSVLVVLVRKKLIVSVGSLAAMVAFVVWAGLSTAWSRNSDLATTRFLTFVQLLTLVLCTWQCLRSEAALAWVARAYGSGAVLAAGLVLYTARQGQSSVLTGYVVPGVDPNDLGLQMAIAIPLVFALPGMRSRLIATVIGILAAATLLLGVLLTGSRGSLIAALGGVVGSLMVVGRFRWWQRLVAASSIGVAGWVAWFALPDIVRYRVLSIPAELAGGGLAGRRDLWSDALTAFEARPLIGAGLASSTSVLSYSGVGLVAHNTILSVAVELGLVGVVLFATIVLTALVTVSRMPSEWRRTWMIVWAVWLVGTLGVSWEYAKVSWLLIGVSSTTVFIGSRLKITYRMPL